MPTPKFLLCALALASTAAAAPTADLALRVDHEITTLSADGVTRITRYRERLLRQGEQTWRARVLPAGAHDAAEHERGGKPHKHLDLAASARWVTRNADGSLRVRMVDAHERQIVDLAPVDYANVDFDGKWASAVHLLDPARLQRMQPLTQPAPAGARWYESRGGELQVRVLWDEQAQYPRRIESRDASGNHRALAVVTREPLPAVLPWTRLDGYAHKDYSDLLD